jgi:hypothetical protein
MIQGGKYATDNKIPSTYGTRSALKLNKTVPFMKTAAGQRHAMYIGPNIYNKLEDKYKTICNIMTFKRRINEFVSKIGRAFNFDWCSV